MEQLLCHKPETTASRHKVTRHAETVFLELEDWMRDCLHWKEALQRAKEARRVPKKRTSWKAPGLHSPAGRRSLFSNLKNQTDKEAQA